MPKIYSRQKMEGLVYLALACLLAIVMFFHEPWFDEIQAWLIAKTAPWKELVWTLPHIEGHPPFWWLLLAIPARLGISGLISLRVIGFVVCMASGYLLIFKSPFPRWVRCLLPFTFFLFYEYGVIVRPYGLIMCVMWLLAIYFPQKDQKPGLYVGLLATLCALHMYGLALAGGIVFAWLWDIKNGRAWRIFISEFIHDKRLFYLAGLLVWAISLIAWIWPVSNASHVGRTGCPWWQEILYLLFVIPADATVTDVYALVPNLQMITFQPTTILWGSFAGLSIWLLSLLALPVGFRKYLLFPYALLISMMGIYVSRHHIGLVLLLWIFVFWIAVQSKEKSVHWEAMKRGASYLLGVILLVGCFWTGVSSFYDCRHSVFNGKDMVAFLRAHSLEDKLIFGEYAKNKTNYNLADMINFYTDHNILANLNYGKEQTYRIHVDISVDESQKDLDFYRKLGYPDVLIGKVDLKDLFGEKGKYSDYVVVYKMEVTDIWKARSPRYFMKNIYVKKDVWKL